MEVFMAKKNEAVLTHKGRQFVIFQNTNGDWCFSYDTIVDRCTGTKDLQIALNNVYEGIDEHVSYTHAQTVKSRQLKPKKGLELPKKGKKKEPNSKLRAI